MKQSPDEILKLNYRHKKAKGRRRTATSDNWDILREDGLWAYAEMENGLRMVTRVLQFIEADTERWRRWLDRLNAVDRAKAVVWLHEHGYSNKN